MPSKDKLKIAYNSQMQTSKTRGIEWCFTFDTWRAWWEATGKLELRGKKKGCYQMCRVGDIGPYAPDNVYCGSVEENSALPTRGKPRNPEACIKTSIALKGKSKTLKHKRNHAFSQLGKLYSTPNGIFHTSKECEEATGVKAATVMWRCKNNFQGQWAYA